MSMEKAKQLYLKQLKARLLKTEPAWDPEKEQDGLAAVHFVPDGRTAAVSVQYIHEEMSPEDMLLEMSRAWLESEGRVLNLMKLRAAVREIIYGAPQEQLNEIISDYKAFRAERNRPVQ